MKVFSDIHAMKDADKRIVIALGTFDGIHCGHRSIIYRARNLAEEIGGTAAVLTFKNHPLSIIVPDKEPLHIMTGVERREVLDQLGVEILFELQFSKELAELSATEFVSLLNKAISPAAIVVGKNYTFGKGASGNAELLKEIGKEQGIRVEICPTVVIDGVPVSSTRIRQLISAGNLQKVNKCLGYDYFVKSIVCHGEKRGRTLGFPTANLEFGPKRAMLPDGAYAVRVKISPDASTELTADEIIDAKNHLLQGIANIGTNPTFGNVCRRIEVNIFDFDDDIYGRELTVNFVSYMRGEEKFSSVEALKSQLETDKAKARLLLCLS